MAFHLRDITLREALTELQKQSNMPFDLQWGGEEALKKKLSLDLETRSFNEAFRAILDEADLKARLQRWSGQPKWHLEFGADEENDAPQSGAGPFQLRVTNISSSLSRYVTPRKTAEVKRGKYESLSVALSLSSDPELPLAKTPRLRVSRAEDEAGRSLLLPPDPNRPNFDYNDELRSQTDVSLQAPEKGSQKLAHLEGIATFVLTDKREHWEVADLLQTPNATHTFSSGGQSVTASVNGAQKRGDTLQFEFELRALKGVDFKEGKNPLFSFGQIAGSLQIRDAKGAALSSGGYSGSGGDNSYTLQLRYPLSAPGVAGANAMTLAGPFTLVFDAPSEFVQTEVPFSFSDLPLP